MTTQQFLLFDCLYLVALVVVAYLTRATPRRIAGADQLARMGREQTMSD
jgi:hypothetical protein